MLLMKPCPDAPYDKEPGHDDDSRELTGPEFIAFIFPHLSMPCRGSKCKRGYHRVFSLILWVLYTGMQWKCMPVPRTADGTALIHYTTIFKVFANWADDGSLEQAFIWRSIASLISTSCMAMAPTPFPKRAAMASAIPATNIRGVRRSSQSHQAREINSGERAALPDLHRVGHAVR
jgi:transposase